VIDSVSDVSGAAADFKKARLQKSARADARPTLDRLPPHSSEDEAGAIGCQLISPNECATHFSEHCPEGAEIYYDLRHQEIQKVITRLMDERVPVDLISVQHELKLRGLLEQIGGIAYLAQLQDAPPSAANFTYYLEYVQEKYLLRRLISTCTDLVGRVYSFRGDVETFLDNAEREILSIRKVSSSQTSIKLLLGEAIQYIEARAHDWSKILGYSTGLIDLDRLTDGIHGGEMIVIGAPTSCGKTTLALQIAMHNALSKIPAGFMSAEMMPMKLALRSVASESRVNIRQVTDSDIPKMTNAVGRISVSPIFIENVNGQTIGQIKARARRMVQQSGIKILVVENIQIIGGVGDNREQKVASVSNGLKSIAMEHNIAVIGLSQLNDDGKLRDSRAIGHDADSAWIIANDGAWQPKLQPVILRVEKCRDGETGNVPLIFVKEQTRFECVSKITEDSIPSRYEK
jgi:replicative DNA helicase